MTINECDGSPVDPNNPGPYTLTTGYLSTLPLCFPPAAELTEYSIDLGGGSWSKEISWDIRAGVNNDEGEIFAQGAAPYHESNCPTPAPTSCSKQIFHLRMFDSFGDG